MYKELGKYTIADNGEYLVGEEAIKYEENEFGRSDRVVGNDSVVKKFTLSNKENYERYSR